MEREDQGEAIVLSRGAGETIIVIPGRQIVTAERLEVLSLGGAADIPDGQPIRAVLRSVTRQGGIPVIPWGFGKWWGHRGRIVRSLIEMYPDLRFCLGDNGGRTRGLPSPPLFQTAGRHGIPVLAGSDPLPLPHHVTRAGSYGFVLEDWHDTPRPAEALRQQLRALTQSPTTFGRLSSAPAMMRSQLGLRWQHRQRSLPGAL